MECDSLKTCIDTFRNTHKTTLGQPYLVSWGKDQKIMKDVLSVYGMNKTMCLISLFFQEMGKSKFLKSTGASVGIFKSQIPNLILKVHTVEEKSQIGRL